MTRLPILIACTAALAACGSEPQVEAENATAEEVAEKVREAGGRGQFVRPGKWESKVTIEEMSFPGMPAEMAEHVKGITDRSEVHQSCLTEEEARRPKEDFFAGNDRNCRYDHFTMADGKIDAEMQCSGGGATQTMTMQGSYTPESYAMQMAMKNEASGGPEGGMTMRMRVDARRIGPCDGTER